MPNIADCPGQPQETGEVKQGYSSSTRNLFTALSVYYMQCI